MPLPMIHLAAARRVAERFPEYHVPAFYLGALSPDAIHMRENASRPEKWESHLRTNPVPPAFSEEFYSDFQSHFPSFPCSPYYAGYFVHLLTDLLWHEEEMFWKKYYGEDPVRSEDKAWYYNDTDQVDKWMYDCLPWRQEIFSTLENADEPPVSSPVTGEEAIKWRDRCFNWFLSYDSIRYRAAKYLTPDEAIAFSDRCGAKIAELIAKMI